MVNPVFIATTTLLKTQLRLSGASQADALAMIDAGIQSARIYLYRVLGAARVAVIQSYSYSDNATTDNEVTRLKANYTELALVRMNLLRTMPTLFMDAAGKLRENWNEEGLTRRASQALLDEEIARLQADIDLWLKELDADDGQIAGDAQGGVMTVPLTCPSRIQINRSLQGGYNHYQDRFDSIALGGCL